MAATRKKKIRRIGVLTGGGDCPGLNAVIRGVSKAAMLDHGISVLGFVDGFWGLVESRFRELDFMSVSGILTTGGTILGTSNIANPFRHPEKNKKGELVLRDRSARAVANCKRLKIDALVTIGGDGTQSIAYRLMKKGVPVVGVPKTIDNDLNNTDVTFGFDTAVQTAVEAIDKIHTTAMSHHRVMIVEVMGRYAGWIALHAGVASGSDVVLIPEIPYDINKVCEFVLQRSRVGKRFSIVCVSEGARPKGGKMTVAKIVKESTDPIRLGGIGNVVGEQITRCTGLETRTCVLGHIQRGGTPSAFDRVLATTFGTHAMNMVSKRKFGRMVSFKNWKVTDVTMLSAVKKQKLVSRNHQLVKTAKAVGTCFGD